MLSHFHLLSRHGRPCAGHPRLYPRAEKTWITGTRPVMTVRVS